MSGVEQGVFNYQEMITYDLHQQMKSSAAAFGSGTTGDFAVVGDLTVGGDITGSGTIEVSDNQDIVVKLGRAQIGHASYGDAATFQHRDNADAGRYALYHGTSGNTIINSRTGQPIQFRNNNTLITTLDEIADACMIGSANAAWVPLQLQGGDVSASYRVRVGYLINLGGDDFYTTWGLPIPTVKGSLKLYIKSLKYGVNDADANDYIHSVFINGLNGQTATQLDTDATTHTSAGDKTFSGAVMPASVIDISGYQGLWVEIRTISTTATQFDLTNVRMECYYDT